MLSQVLCLVKPRSASALAVAVTTERAVAVWVGLYTPRSKMGGASIATTGGDNQNRRSLIQLLLAERFAVPDGAWYDHYGHPADRVSARPPPKAQHRPWLSSQAGRSCPDQGRAHTRPCFVICGQYGRSQEG